MNAGFHALYILGSVVAALVAGLGIALGEPVLYGIIPGIIGGLLTIIAAYRFFRHKQDLVGFVATLLGFVYYQAYQANPVMLPVFSATLTSISPQDQVIGIVLSNLTAAAFLLATRLMRVWFRGTIENLCRARSTATTSYDGLILAGFFATFVFVALPNVLFGKVVVGSIHSILYQRLTWDATSEYSGYQVWGGAVGASAVNLGLWASSLFMLWLYLLSSRYRLLMVLLAPLVLLWTAGVALQGSRTYLMAVGVVLAVYLVGSPRFRGKAFFHAAWAGAAFLILMQVSTLFRNQGLQAVNSRDLASHFLEIQGNEGVSNQIDGVEYFRTELLNRGVAPNPILGVLKGIFVRPFEGFLTPLPRTLFPWKPDDQSQREFTLYYQNVRLGVPSTEIFMGASAGLFGQELIRYGIFGPLTLLFWLGLLLALADRLFETGAASNLNRIFAAVLVAFVAAQARDYNALWFLPFLPAGITLTLAIRRANRSDAPGGIGSGVPPRAGPRSGSRTPGHAE